MVFLKISQDIIHVSFEKSIISFKMTKSSKNNKKTTSLGNTRKYTKIVLTRFITRFIENEKKKQVQTMFFGFRSSIGFGFCVTFLNQI